MDHLEKLDSDLSVSLQVKMKKLCRAEQIKSQKQINLLNLSKAKIEKINLKI